RERCPPALLRCRVAVFGRGSKTVCLSLERDTRAERDLLFHRRLRSELLVPILSGAENHVATSEHGGKRQGVWTGYCTARTQLSLPAHVSSGTTRSQTAFGTLR